MKQVYPIPSVSRGVARSMDVAHFNQVANDPQVRPWLGGEGPLDLTAIVTDPESVAFATAHGGFLCVAQGFSRFEVHSLFLPDRPGGETLHAMREGLDYMFTETHCVELVTKIPQTNRAAAALAGRAGFETRFTAALSPQDPQPTEYAVLSLDRWAVRSPWAKAMGHWFHDALTDAKTKTGSTFAVHPDDAVHDAMAGATVAMVHAGQVSKAVTFYNQWARWAGYAPIALLRERPVILDIHDAILEARATELEVLRCR